MNVRTKSSITSGRTFATVIPSTIENSKFSLRENSSDWIPTESSFKSSISFFVVTTLIGELIFIDLSEMDFKWMDEFSTSDKMGFSKTIPKFPKFSQFHEKTFFGGGFSGMGFCGTGFTC